MDQAGKNPNLTDRPDKDAPASANSEGKDTAVKRVVLESDPYLGALKTICSYHDLPFSKGVATHAMQLAHGRLAHSQILSAAENLGLEAQIVRRKPSKASSVVCPYLVITQSGDTYVVVEKDNAKREFQVAFAGGSTKQIGFDDLDGEDTSFLVYLAPVKSRHQRGWADQSAPKGHWLWSVVGRFWGNWTNVIVSTFLINLLGLALPLFVMNVYDRVIPNNSIPTLWALALGVMLALVFDFILRMVRSGVIDSSGRRIDMRVSSLLFRKALDIKMSNRTGRSGDMANSVRDFESVRDFFTSASISSLIDLMFVGIFLAVLWMIVGPLAFVPLVAVPLVIAVTILIQFPLAKSVAEAQATTANRHSVLVESLVGIETVKAVRAEGVMQKRWEDAVAGSVRASSSTKFWSSLAIWFTTFVQQSVSVAIIVWGVFLVAEQAITIGALIAANILAGRILSPLGGIAMTLARAQQSFASLNQLNSMMALKGDHEVADGTHRPDIANSAIHLKDLAFAYPGTEEKSLMISKLNIAPGERVGVIGRVGSGKSTLGKLLSGLYESEGGDVQVGGHELSQYSKADLREAVMYVGQEAELFSGSLQENITFSRPIEEKRMRAALSTSGVGAFAQGHPHGFELQVGERGRNLSGGQRQAVCLARALVQSPDVLFLDEPTSSMDNASEASFVHGLKDWLTSDTTLIVATHRHSLLEIVNRVIVMDNGKIVADGPRKQVLAKLKASGTKGASK